MYTITKVRDIVPTVRDAFKVCQSGTPGPVFIELPNDVLYPYKRAIREVGKPSIKGLKGQLLARSFENHMKNVFAGAFDREWDTSPLNCDVPFAKKSDVSGVAELVKNAKKPVIVLGSQSVLPPVGAEK